MRRTLERLAQGFALSVHGSDGRVRFRRFGLVNWLTQAGAAGGSPYAGGMEGNDHTLLQGLRQVPLDKLLSVQGPRPGSEPAAGVRAR